MLAAIIPGTTKPRDNEKNNLPSFVMTISCSTLTSSSGLEKSEPATINFLESKIDKANLFISTVQGLIAAVLLITILIEVIESLREYKQKNNINYINVIIEIAIIAVVRHILIMEFEHINGNTLLGVSSLIFVLGFLYFILNKKIKLGKNEE